MSDLLASTNTPVSSSSSQETSTEAPMEISPYQPFLTEPEDVKAWEASFENPAEKKRPLEEPQEPVKSKRKYVRKAPYKKREPKQPTVVEGATEETVQESPPNEPTLSLPPGDVVQEHITIEEAVPRIVTNDDSVSNETPTTETEPPIVFLTPPPLTASPRMDTPLGVAPLQRNNAIPPPPVPKSLEEQFPSQFKQFMRVNSLIQAKENVTSKLPQKSNRFV